MNLIDQARLDVQQIIAGEFSVMATFTTPDNSVTQTIPVIHTKHHTSINTEGIRVNSRNASLSFYENSLTGYPVRSSKGNVSMKGHSVKVKDSTGVDKNYSVTEQFPDETLGLIVLILGSKD
ncbi:MAG TPA: hypothetical protein VL728_19510 [Cyclobacteriaceae bacterium]|jgi:hypothetical protein|nr:hypothetical protein [Cyclobacteriaceae bacterium]